MNTSFQHPHPDPDISALIQRLNGVLNEIADRSEELLPALEAGTPLQSLHAAPEEDPDSLYPIGARLCDEGEFRHALPIALYLTAYHGDDQRNAFMAGACLQRLGVHDQALTMYQACMLAGGEPLVAPMYRAGECLMAMGEREHALRAFEEAFDLGRASSDYVNMQAMAGNRIEQLRAGG